MAATIDLTAVTAAPAIVQDQFLLDILAEAKEFAVGGMRSRTFSNLGVAGCVVRLCEHNILAVAKTRDHVKAFRAQSIAAFSIPCSQVTGDSWTVNKLDESHKVHYLIQCLPPDVQTLAPSVNWESLRTLARWATHNVTEDLFEPGSVYAEAWALKTGCEAKAAELVTALATSPMERDELVKALDAHEVAIGAKTAKTVDEDGPADKFLASVKAGRERLKWTKAKLLSELVRVKQIDKPAEAFDPANMTEAEAQSVIDKLTAWISAARANAKPAGPVTITLNATSKPNHDPLASAQTRNVA